MGAGNWRSGQFSQGCHDGGKRGGKMLHGEFLSDLVLALYNCEFR
jgi:hypothetical protein